MKKLLTLTAAALMSLALLTAVPQVKANDELPPSYSEETIPPVTEEELVPETRDPRLDNT